ncbi:MAG: hypothetical protein ACOVN0_08365 [Niveispirillum sp.]|uniref:hypothetical protein n=1 Tax=Niveispirillum sp. TaxID=1917217 RepID=UPI003BA7A6ED
MTDQGDSGRTRKLMEEFAPTTFEERGVTVPFTTPLLSQARLRRDQNDRFEFLLPNFTAGKGTYVLAWKGLPSVMTLTLHDRLLFEEIEKLETHSPEQIRACALAVQATGVCGPEAATRGAALRDQDGQYLVLTQFILVTELLKLVNISAADLLRPGMTADDSKRVARQALAKVAAMVDIPPDDMSARVDQLGEAVAPVGLPQAPRSGRLRAMADRLYSFAQGTQHFADTDPSEAAMLGTYVATVANHTLTLARQRIGKLDAACRDARQIVNDAPTLYKSIQEYVARISWLLDGWEFLIAMWESVKDEPSATKQTTITDISRLLPMIPREEISAATESLDLDAIQRMQKKWVRVNQDWRTGVLDMDAVMRLESLKAAMG